MPRAASKAFIRALERARQEDRAREGDREAPRPEKSRPEARRPKPRKPTSTMADVRRAKASFDAHRTRQEALGAEVCLVVVGYASGREPFRLLGRVSADTGLPAMPDPPITDAEMQSVAHAAKMAFAKALLARRRKT